MNDLQFLYSFKLNFLEELTLSLMLNNILNEEYETNAWIYRYYDEGSENKMDGYFPQAGFHVFAGLTIRF